MAAGALPAATLALLLLAAAGSRGFAFQLELHSRFSPGVLRWAESVGHPGVYAPTPRTPEYYAALARHDGLLRRNRRALAGGASAELAFADGNSTVQFSSLGFLYYAIVALGTPNTTFLVALDTGSDLFWVPCNCAECAPSRSLSYPENGHLEFSTYSPENSSTSKNITCSNSLCPSRGACSSSSTSCPYTVQYLSDGTSSSGVVVEDIIYFLKETGKDEVVSAPIVFGCGQVQTGQFLGLAAPNGLLGLGLEDVSVPSVLSSKGLISNSFSMCFGGDGMGRINFGDQGNSDQQETPLNTNGLIPTYNISLVGLKVGNITMNSGITAIIDTGTSFTTLADPVYTQITSSFNKQVKDSSTKFGSSVPFKYCYTFSSGGSPHYPNISLLAQGGGKFPINDPIVSFYDTNNAPLGYCLAVVQSSDTNIIGENFMTGLRVVFDRERMVLGWMKYNCYHADNPSTINSSSPTQPAGAAVAPSIPEATNLQPNGTQVSVINHSSCQRLHLRSILCSIVLAASVLFCSLFL